MEGELELESRGLAASALPPTPLFIPHLPKMLLGTFHRGDLSGQPEKSAWKRAACVAVQPPLCDLVLLLMGHTSQSLLAFSSVASGESLTFRIL